MNGIGEILCQPILLIENYEWYKRDPMVKLMVILAPSCLPLWWLRWCKGGVEFAVGFRLGPRVRYFQTKLKAMFTNLLIYCIPSRLCHPLDKILSVIFSPSKLLDWPQFWICYNYCYLGILQVMGYSDTDVAEYLYTSKPQIDSLVNFLCKDLTKACSTKPPPVPKVIAFWTNTLGDLFMPFWGAFSVK